MPNWRFNNSIVVMSQFIKCYLTLYSLIISTIHCSNILDIEKFSTSFLGYQSASNITGNSKAYPQHFKFLYEDPGHRYHLFGARNYLYNISIQEDGTVHENQHLFWETPADKIKACSMYYTLEDCQNYILLFAVLKETNLVLVCGTYAFEPTCRKYRYNQRPDENGHWYSMVEQFDGLGYIPHIPQQNSTYTAVDGEIYSGTFVDVWSDMPIIYRPKVRTVHQYPPALFRPQFIHSFRHKDHIYFLFNEWILSPKDRDKYHRVTLYHLDEDGDTLYTPQRIQTIIARVCINDKGYLDLLYDNPLIWRTYLKTRLICHVSSDGNNLVPSNVTFNHGDRKESANSNADEYERKKIKEAYAKNYIYPSQVKRVYPYYAAQTAHQYGNYYSDVKPHVTAHHDLSREGIRILDKKRNFAKSKSEHSQEKDDPKDRKDILLLEYNTLTAATKPMSLSDNEDNDEIFYASFVDNLVNGQDESRQINSAICAFSMIDVEKAFDQGITELDASVRPTNSAQQKHEEKKSRLGECAYDLVIPREAEAIQRNPTIAFSVKGQPINIWAGGRESLATSLLAVPLDTTKTQEISTPKKLSQDLIYFGTQDGVLHTLEVMRTRSKSPVSDRREKVFTHFVYANPLAKFYVGDHDHLTGIHNLPSYRKNIFTLLLTAKAEGNRDRVIRLRHSLPQLYYNVRGPDRKSIMTVKRYHDNNPSSSYSFCGRFTTCDSCISSNSNRKCDWDMREHICVNSTSPSRARCSSSRRANVDTIFTNKIVYNAYENAQIPPTPYVNGEHNNPNNNFVIEYQNGSTHTDYMAPVPYDINPILQSFCQPPPNSQQIRGSEDNQMYYTNGKAGSGNTSTKNFNTLEYQLALTGVLTGVVCLVIGLLLGYKLHAKLLTKKNEDKFGRPGDNLMLMNSLHRHQINGAAIPPNGPFGTLKPYDYYFTGSGATLKKPDNDEIRRGMQNYSNNLYGMGLDSDKKTNFMAHWFPSRLFSYLARGGPNGANANIYNNGSSAYSPNTKSSDSFICQQQDRIGVPDNNNNLMMGLVNKDNGGGLGTATLTPNLAATLNMYQRASSPPKVNATPRTLAKQPKTGVVPPPLLNHNNYQQTPLPPAPSVPLPLTPTYFIHTGNNNSLNQSLPHPQTTHIYGNPEDQRCNTTMLYPVDSNVMMQSMMDNSNGNNTLHKLYGPQRNDNMNHLMQGQTFVYSSQPPHANHSSIYNVNPLAGTYNSHNASIISGGADQISISNNSQIHLIGPNKTESGEGHPHKKVYI